jgi:O-antigen/teichoic acid export membrane protein
VAQIFKNTFFNSITLGFRFLSSSLLFVIIARALGVEEFGRFAFALSFTGIFLVFADYGFNLLIVRDVAVSPTDALRIVNRVLNGKLVLAVAATAVLVIAIKSLDYPPETELLVYVLWAAALMYSFGLVLNTVFRGLNRFQYETYPTVILNAVQFALVAAMLLMGFGSISVALAYLVSRAVYLMVSLRLVRRKIGRLGFSVEVVDGLRILNESLPFGVHAILAVLYFQLDTVFLSYLSGDAEVGYYQAAMRVVMALMIAHELIATSYFPVLARDFKADPVAFRAHGAALNKYMLLAGALSAAFLLPYSGSVIGVLYGERYLSAAPVMRLLSVVVFLRFLGASYANFITVADSQRLRALGVGLSVVVNVALNLALIPRYGAAGAAVASIFTHLFLEALYIAFAVRLTGSFFIDAYCLKGLAVIAAGGAALYMLRGYAAPAVLGAVIFVPCLALLAAAAFSGEERRALKGVFRRRSLIKGPGGEEGCAE